MTAAQTVHQTASGSPVDAFREAMRSAGLEPPDEIVADGTLHRFASDGRPGDDAGFYVLHLDGVPAGNFGCHRAGVKQNWSAKAEQAMSASERSEHKAKMDAMGQAREADQAIRHAEAATKAATLWDAAKPAPDDHPYLASKGVKAHEIRQHTDGRLIVPVRVGEVLRSLQFIDNGGAKQFLVGGKVKGGYYGIGKRKAKALCIVEGFATGASIHEATGYAVAVAFNAGNLQAVAEALHERCPDLPLIVCGDDDTKTEGNPGRTKATEAAQSVGARLAFPDGLDWGTDFNDMAQQRGLDAVRAGVAADEAPEVAADEWPDLVSLSSPKLPSLDPARLLPGWAGDYAAALADSTETPPELAAALVLATCSAAAARRLRVQVSPGHCVPCNLWLVVALPPGNRKSAVQSAASEPLISWERDKAAEEKPEILKKSSERKTQEARAKELRRRAASLKDRKAALKDAEEAAEIEANLTEVPPPTQLWTSDSTPERMGTLLADNDECMAWLSAEGGVFDLLQGRYSKGIPNLDLMLKAWSGDAERVDRGSRPPVYLQHPALTVGLSPQPDVLRGLAAVPGFRGRGLLARFLYLLPQSPLGYRTLDAAPIPNGVRDAYAAGVRAMLDWAPSVPPKGEAAPHLLELTPEAYTEWKEFEQSIETSMRPGGDFEQATDWAGKAPGAAARLAGVLHGIKHAHGVPWEVLIALETMESALEIMAVIARHSLAALDLMGADEGIAAARRVWQWVDAGRRETFIEREAYQALKGTFPRMEGLRTALGVLEERGYLEVGVSPNQAGPGRKKSPTVTVRPDIAEGWR